MTDLTPFTVSIDDTVIQDLKSRLKRHVGLMKKPLMIGLKACR